MGVKHCTHRNTHYVELENDERELECSDCGRDTYGADKWTGLTCSLDAALALCERVLPGWGYRIRKDRKHGNIEAFVDSPDDPMRTFIGRHDKGNDALALCLAILRARASLSPGEKTDG